MNEFCITFVSGEGAPESKEHYHTHVMAFDAQSAVEGALMSAAVANVDMSPVDAVAVNLLLSVPDTAKRMYEDMRVALHQGRDPKTQVKPDQTCHLH